MNKETMARNINRYLTMFDMEKQELADKLGVSGASVSGWVNAKYYPRINYIEEMAEIFHCQKSDLIEDQDKKIVNVYELTTEEYLLIKAYRETDEVGKEMVKRALNYYSKLNELERSIYEHN